MKLKNKLLLGGLTAVLLAVMSFSAWKIWVIRSEYHLSLIHISEPTRPY